MLLENLTTKETLVLVGEFGRKKYPACSALELWDKHDIIFRIFMQWNPLDCIINKKYWGQQLGMSLMPRSAPNNLGMEILIYTYFVILLYLWALQRTEQVYLNKLFSCPCTFNQHVKKINSSNVWSRNKENPVMWNKFLRTNDQFPSSQSLIIHSFGRYI